MENRAYIFILLTLFLFACVDNVSENNFLFYKNSFFSMQNLERWNVSTIQDIDSMTLSNKGSDQIQYIKSSLINVKDSDFPNKALLSRESFFEFMKNDSLLDAKAHCENIYILERHTQGEVFARDKIFILQKKDRSMFLTAELTRKGWNVINRGTFTDVDLDSLYNEPLSRSNIYWGSGMEEFLIITKFKGDLVTTKFFTGLTKDQYRKFNSLFSKLY